jgi:putative membrane protein
MTTTPPPSPLPAEVLAEATFDRDSLVKYHWVGLLPVCVFIVTIPIVIIVAIVYAMFLDRMIASWSATLTRRSLIVRKGIFNKVERTIPLEKITDLSSSQGPIMRHFGLKRLGVETAGQSGGTEGGALVSLIGIVDPDGFRQKVLDQRDRVTDNERPGMMSSPAATTTAAPESNDVAATLHRIEAVLERIADRLDRDDA